MTTILNTAVIVAALLPRATAAQEQPSPVSRTAALEQAQAEKAADLRPFEPGKVEHILNRIEKTFLSRRRHVHPFFESAYAGGGFTLGAAYLQHVSSYNTLDLRGSITFSGYKRIEAVFTAPRLFDRHGVLTLTGGWREATAVGFYGIGSANTSKDDRANYSFDQPYAVATIDLWPARKLLLLRGELEFSQWNTGPGNGPAPPVDDLYTPETLPGLGASPSYLHAQGTVAIDSRPSPGYARRGGFYGVTYHDFHDQDGAFGFRQTDVELIQHLPILRDVWVLSLHGRAQLAEADDGQAVPYFMLPSLGGGSSLRGFASWRFRDMNSLLLQAEWRVIASRPLDMAFFYDAGRVAARRADLTDGPLKSDYGVGFRLHSLVATPLRIEFAKSNEGLALVFSAKAAF
jgi:hypothetical protein